MNLNELMLGNIVLYKDKPYRLTGIPTKTVCTIDVDGHDVTVAASDINPIVLSDEFLKENGYTAEKVSLSDDEDDPDAETQYLSADMRIVLVSDDRLTNSYRLWFVRVDNSDMDTIGTGEVTYVHQLQNLLTTFGVNAEFKI